MVEWDADYLPNLKLGLHSMQILFGFVVFVLEIILFRSDNAVINGNNGWPFGLVSLPSHCCAHSMHTPLVVAHK